jgi:hypothetical protein
MNSYLRFFYIEGDFIFRDLLTQQIKHLDIDIKKTTEQCSTTVAKIFALILSLCENLIDLICVMCFPHESVSFLFSVLNQKVIHLQL